MPNFWKSAKPVKKIFNSPILKKYPVRTRKEIRTISMHPSRDSDKDGVMNWYDCKPLNKYKQEREKYKQMQKVISEHEEIKKDITEIKQLLLQLMDRK
jgi:hypothetical protein